MNYIIEYQNGEQIASNQLVKANEAVRLRIRLEYRSDLNAEDLPTTTQNFSLGFTVNYVQADSTGISVKDNGGFLITANGSLDEIGTIITIGDQQFYTIGSDENNVKLLSMYNLYVGNSVDEEWNVIPLVNPTGKQSELAKGWEDSAEKWYGTTVFSNIDSTYEGSLVEEYVNIYREILEGEEYGIPVVEARLITIEELTDTETFACSDGEYCSSKYPWIYSTTYWSGSIKSDSLVWVVDIGMVFANDYDNDNTYGVRPVIVISKTLF